MKILTEAFQGRTGIVDHRIDHRKIVVQDFGTLTQFLDNLIGLSGTLGYTIDIFLDRAYNPVDLSGIFQRDIRQLAYLFRYYRKAASMFSRT